MRGVGLLALAAAALALVAPALASDGMEKTGTPAGPARALALQALALLEQGRGHQQAEQKLDQALGAGDRGNLDVRALRAAHAALHRQSTAEAQTLLRDAFPAGSSHLVGVTYRPRIATARVVAGALGIALAVVAALGLHARRRSEQRSGLAYSTRQPSNDEQGGETT